MRVAGEKITTVISVVGPRPLGRDLERMANHTPKNVLKFVMGISGMSRVEGEESHLVPTGQLS